MAQRTQVILTDDIDGGEADESITFAFDGRTYEIDLSKRNADKFRKALSPYLEAAASRRWGSRRPARRGQRRT